VSLVHHADTEEPDRAPRHHDIVRLDALMNQAAPMKLLQALEKPLADANGVARADRRAIPERRQLHPFHDQLRPGPPRNAERYHSSQA
jgi:hypothetical protein